MARREDMELAAIRTILKALSRLPGDDARDRVGRYIYERRLAPDPAQEIVVDQSALPFFTRPEREAAKAAP